MTTLDFLKCIQYTFERMSTESSDGAPQCNTAYVIADNES